MNLTRGIKHRDLAGNPNIEIVQRSRRKTSKLICNAAWYIPSDIIQRHPRISTIKEEITDYGVEYRARLGNRKNLLAVSLLDPSDHNSEN